MRNRSETLLETSGQVGFNRRLPTWVAAGRLGPELLRWADPEQAIQQLVGIFSTRVLRHDQQDAPVSFLKHDQESPRRVQVKSADMTQLLAGQTESGRRAPSPAYVVYG